MKASIVIQRNMEDVFDFVRTPENLIDKERAGWITIDADGPVSAGSRFNTNFKIGPVTRTAKYEVIAYERPYRLTLLVMSPPGGVTSGSGRQLKNRQPPPVPPMEDRIELKAAPQGTRLTRTFRSKSGNRVGWLLGLPLSPLANWGMSRDLRRLKTRIESALP